MFQFTIHNIGIRVLYFDHACGGHPPIVVDTADGTFGTGYGYVNCMTCEELYGGYYHGCTDCGPPAGHTLEPGGTVAYEWDRRVWMDHIAPAACEDVELTDVHCALGVRADDATSGSVSFCGLPVGTDWCSAAETVPFSFDLAQASVAIDLE